MDERAAVYAFLIATAVAAAITPLVRAFARRAGAVDRESERGLGPGGTPLLGGLAILAGALAAAALELHMTTETRAILGGAVAIAVVGALDDRFELPPGVKLLGQAGAALIPVLSGVSADHVTLPFVGAFNLGRVGGDALTLLGLVTVMNVVNLSDGIDGLAAGVCTISAGTFAVIAFDLQRNSAGVLAALTAGAALGFLFHNFHPASVFMGDCGSNLLGMLLGCTAVLGSLKTNAVLALLFPLIVLAVPFMDTTFVVLKRLKYRRAPYRPDANHFHHRLSRIGFSQRRTVLYLYAWTLLMAGLALALRFVPYSDNGGSFDTRWSVVMVMFGLVALAASAYLVYVLEILKFKRRFLRRRPELSEHEVDAQVEQSLETGEFESLS